MSEFKLPKNSNPAREQLRVARLLKAHGLKGAIKLELYTDDPDRRFVPGAVFTLQVPDSSSWRGKTLTVSQFRWMNSSPVAFFEEITDRTQAESALKAILWIDQDPAELESDDDSWYDHQLTGLNAVVDGEVVGKIIRVEHMSAQDLLIVQTDSGEVMVPFVKAIVPEVDTEAGVVTMTPPAGLFEVSES